MHNLRAAVVYEQYGVQLPTARVNIPLNNAISGSPIAEIGDEYELDAITARFTTRLPKLPRNDSLSDSLRIQLMTSNARSGHNNGMHAKPDLRVFLKWKIAGSGSVIPAVIQAKTNDRVS